MGKVKGKKTNRTNNAPIHKKFKKNRDGGKISNKSKMTDKSKKFNPKNNQAKARNESATGRKMKNKNKKKSINKYQNVQDQEISSTTTVIKEEKEASSVPAADEPLSASSVKQENKGKVVQATQKSLSTLWYDYKPCPHTLIRTDTDWRSQLVKEENESDETDACTKRRLKELGAKILKQESTLYSNLEEKGSRGKEIKFRRTVFSHGTSKDKLAAHVLRCMEAPAHSLSNLNALVSMITPKAKNSVTEIFDSLKDLLESVYLPKGQLTRKFESHNFTTLSCLMVTGREQAEKQLALWYFEDQLAHVYLRLVKQLMAISQTVDKTKVQGVRCLVHLISSNPGQDLEGAAMKAVVYKLGDPSRKVASQTMFHLRSLLFRHRSLKPQVVDHIEDMMYRTNLSDKGKFYCLCFLKDMIFGSGEQKLAEKLLNLYFGFFKNCMMKGEVSTRLMSALLRGINRAYPYAQQSGGKVEEQLDTLYKLCHLVNFNIATQTLQLIYQVLKFKNEVSDRFYQVVYHQLLDMTSGVSTATSAFLNLVFKAMVRDESLHRVLAFIKRLLQVSMHQNSNVAAGIIFLASEVVREKPGLFTLMTCVLGLTNSSDGSGGGDDSKDCLEAPTDDDNNDDDFSEDKLFGARTKTNGGVYVSMKMKEESPCSREDAQEKVSGECSSDNPVMAESAQFTTTASSSDMKPPDNNSRTSHQTSYDPYCRNPLYAGSQNTSVWELRQLGAHFHPSVSLYGGQVLAGKTVACSGDPLQDYTLTRFLDRFVYRNPKKTVTQDDGAGGYLLGRRDQHAHQGVRGLDVTSSTFAKLDPKKVPVDHMFLHRYFSRYRNLKSEKEDDVSDSESVQDDEFDEYLSKVNWLEGGCKDVDFDDDLDFASGAKQDKRGESDDDEDESMDEDDGGFGEDDEFGGDGDFSGDEFGDEEGDDDGDDFVDEDDWGKDEMGADMSDDDVEFDEEAVAFSDDDDFGMDNPKKKKTAMAKMTKKGKKDRKGRDMDSMFDDAEEFAHMLAENTDDGIDTTSMKAVSNRDRASGKHIKWEREREQKMTNQAWRRNKFKSSGHKRDAKFRKPEHKRDATRNIKGTPNFKAKRGQFKKSKRGRK